MIKLELSIDEVQISLVGLSKLPYEAVAVLIEKIKSQAQPQVQTEETKQE